MSERCNPSLPTQNSEYILGGMSDCTYSVEAVEHPGLNVGQWQMDPAWRR